MAIEDFTTESPSGAEAPLPIRSTPCCANLRRLTVTRLANGKPDLVPQLRVKGQWAAFEMHESARPHRSWR